MLLLALLFSACQNGGQRSIPDNLLTPNVKGPTDKTVEAIDAVLNELPFPDREDFDNATRGFIATLPYDTIKDEAETPVFNLAWYNFLDSAKAIGGTGPNMVNRSLYRQSWLNAKHGLFSVIDSSIYQIRAFDLANMTIVRSKKAPLDINGRSHQWIVIDPLGSPPTAKAGWELFKAQIDPGATISDIIFTHSHIDHFGGVKGIATDAELQNSIKVWAPEGFFEEGVSENIMAGNCMGRRASYMYGNVLPKSDSGTVGTGLGTTTSSGMAGIVQPSDGCTISNLELTTPENISGLSVSFIYTPSSEAPAEMMFYFHDYEAFCQAEDINRTLHNLYTLRGAKVRNGQKWSLYIDKVIQNWSENVTVSFGSHHWPTWDKANIIPYWEKQRDLYRFIHDQTLRLANRGYTPIELADTIEIPDALSGEFYNRGYYGSYSHDIKAQYQLYFGWFDGNPANLDPLPPVEAGSLYVDMMGGRDSVMNKAYGLYEDGNFRFAAEILRHLVFADPGDTDAKYMLANTYEQLGYQAESGPWRNFYLSGASELRTEVNTNAPSPDVAAPDMIKGMTNELFFNFLAMRFKGTDPGVDEMDYVFQIDMPDLTDPVDQYTQLVVSNAAVTPRIGAQADIGNPPTTTIRMDRVYWNELISAKIPFIDKVNELETNGHLVYSQGDRTAFTNFATHVDVFEFWFNIVTP